MSVTAGLADGTGCGKVTATWIAPGQMWHSVADTPSWAGAGVSVSRDGIPGEAVPDAALTETSAASLHQACQFTGAPFAYRVIVTCWPELRSAAVTSALSVPVTGAGVRTGDGESDGEGEGDHGASGTMPASPAALASAPAEREAEGPGAGEDVIGLAAQAPAAGADGTGPAYAPGRGDAGVIVTR